jgi:putative exosortase-associated protein (TIGR04073 family)
MKKQGLRICAAVMFVLLTCNAGAQIEEAASVRPLPLTGYSAVRPATNEEFLRYVNIEQTYYYNSPVSKGSAGVVNVATAWAEVPYYMSEVAQDEDFFAGWTFGLGKGIFYGLARGVAGVADTATFIIPPYDQPMIEPAYEVKKPQTEGFKIKILEW